MPYFDCDGCGKWETTDLYECFKLRGKTFCENCYDKLVTAKPELANLDWNDSGSTWQVSNEEWARTRGLPMPKKERINWKKIIPEVFVK